MTAVPSLSVLALLPLSGLTLAIMIALVAMVALAFTGYAAVRAGEPERLDEESGRIRWPRVPNGAQSRPSNSSSDSRLAFLDARAPGAALRSPTGDGREYALGREPVVIGSAPDACKIVLKGPGIAPEHARIWLSQGRYVLHHVGGLSRKTYVSGQEADWVILDPGDEVTIGGHRLVFEHREAIAAVAVQAEVREASGPELDDDLARMLAAVRALWSEAMPASETAVGERSGTGKYKVHRRKDELAPLVGGQWVKRGRTVVLER